MAYGAEIWGPLLVGAFGSLFGGGKSDTPMTTEEQRQLQQQMLQLLQRQQAYMGQMDPLRESVLRMAMGMLPIRYQTDLGFRVPPTGGGASPWGAGGSPGYSGGSTVGSEDLQDQNFTRKAEGRYGRFSRYDTPEEILEAFGPMIGRRSPRNQPNRPRPANPEIPSY